MAKPITDGDFGARMHREITRLFPTPGAAIAALDCSYFTLRSWREGCAPGAYWLSKLHELGGDVMYVVTGRRS